MKIVIIIAGLLLVLIFLHKFFSVRFAKKQAKRKLQTDFDNCISKVKNYIQISKEALSFGIEEGNEITRILNDHGVSDDEKPISHYGLTTYVIKVNIVNDQLESNNILNIISEKIALLKQVNECFTKLPKEIEVKTKYDLLVVKLNKLTTPSTVVSKLIDNYQLALDNYNKQFNKLLEMFNLLGTKDFVALKAEYNKLVDEFQIMVGFDDLLKQEIKKEEEIARSKQTKEDLAKILKQREEDRKETTAQRILRQDRLEKSRRSKITE